MNKDILRQQLAEDEGCKYEVYLDHLGLPTCGIGHLITESDEENGKPVGETVTQERVQSLFNLDIAITLEDCRRLYSDFDELPEEAQLIIANMCFNLGYPRLSKFKDMKAAVNARDWTAAGAAMIDSRWYTQVPNRARRLVDRMKKLGEEA
tara:strand:- start:54 stop:506 length:453 start_codon:yes stop_codon:yes gene_type:complete